LVHNRLTTKYANSLTDERSKEAVYFSPTLGYYDGFNPDVTDGYLIQEAHIVPLAAVASVGDVRNFKLNNQDLLGFNVCDEGGPVSSGDLLCSSSTPGYLMKQSDEIIYSYTVGKALEKVTFIRGKASNVYGYIYCG
jgi:hypothetical protein